jgi:pyridoxine kinase
MMQNARVLSIQSHVTHGYVGNKCAILPLNRLGMDVDSINTVNFSNHTGYPAAAGQVLDGAGLLELIDGLESNGLLNYTHLLTGYIGSLSLLETIAGVVDRLTKINPLLVYGRIIRFLFSSSFPELPKPYIVIYIILLFFSISTVCDPVQGDDGRLYCKPELPHAFRTTVLPIASIITPNQYEAELLSEVSITSEQDALTACAILHSKGPHTVIITSLNLDPKWVTIIASSTSKQQQEEEEEEQEQQLQNTAFNGTSNNNAKYTQYKLRVPRVDGYFTGTGDLFTALLLGWLHRHPKNLKLALEYAVAGLQTVLLDTVEYALTHGGGPEEKERDAGVCAARELRLIQNQDALAAPGSIIYQALRTREPWPNDT